MKYYSKEGRYYLGPSYSPEPPFNPQIKWIIFFCFLIPFLSFLIFKHIL